MSNNHLESLTDDGFDERVTGASASAVVDFWAPWCDPCKLLEPILVGLSERHSDVDFWRMNIDEEKSTPELYSVNNIPTILFFKDGGLVNQIIGVASEEKIEEAVKGLL